MAGDSVLPLTNTLPTLVITTGEPAGVGIEVTLKALTRNYSARIAILGDPEWIGQINRDANLQLNLQTRSCFDEVTAHMPGQVQILPIGLAQPAKLGQLNPNNAMPVLDQLTAAHKLAIEGHVQAIVTAPVHKANLTAVDPQFTGHTEFFAALSGASQVVMMLSSEAMNVALATTHLPLKKVAESITQSRLERVLQVCVKGLQRLGIERPAIKVLGLNPHAGEQGLLGSEESQIIAPAIEACQSLAATITGPYPADTAFNPTNLKSTDLFIAMFHDQGLPVIKYASFGRCANVTLGLPYLRTSVDHGTALDIAPHFRACSSSMEYALRFALCESLLSSSNSPSFKTPI